MKLTTLSNFMLTDHAKIHKLLREIKENLGKNDTLLFQAIDNFEWKIQKHYFTEENAIFTTYTPVNEIAGYDMVPKIIKQHQEILRQLKMFKKCIIKKKTYDFEYLLKLLKAHKKYEESNLYPMLEKGLSNQEKKIIIKRINEIL